MSLPDYMLEEPPDPVWCEEHGTCKPCFACFSDACDRRFDARRDDREIRERDVLEELCSELQVQAFSLQLHDADAKERWFANCAQVLAAIHDPAARASQAMNFAMGLAVQGVPSQIVLRQLGEERP